MSADSQAQGSRSADVSSGSGSALTDRAVPGVAATLLVTGQLLYIVVTQFHAGGDANNHPEIFAVYANSAMWTVVHAGQFLAVAILLAGLAALPAGLTISSGAARWAGKFGSALAWVALGLYGVLQAVDGVGNKQADQAWANADGVDEAARFASAEALRWLEWGARSYQDFAMGIALLLVAAAVAHAAGVPRLIAYLMALSGLAYLVQGWVVGSEGFSGTHTVWILLAWIISLVWMVWLAIVALRGRKEHIPPLRD